MELFLGVDVSKGYIDVAFINKAGSHLSGEGRYDDTRMGHDRVRKAIHDQLQENPSASLKIALESTGGLERNWLRLFKILSDLFAGQVLVFLLNPLLVKRFRNEDLHSSGDDASSAIAIAEYLRLGRPASQLSGEHHLEAGVSCFYRCIKNTISRLADLANEIQSLLPQIQPELVQFARSGLPTWLLELLEKYPTAPLLAKAPASTLDKFPSVTLEKAQRIRTAAKQSVASLRDEATAEAMRLLAHEYLFLSQELEKQKIKLLELVGQHRQVELLSSVPGIGPWTAISLLVEIGDIARFSTPESLVAYAGLDPSYFKSGDGEVRHGISKRGNSHIRAALYMPAQVAVMHNPVIRGFYHRLREHGKSHREALVACMAKLLRIGFALLVTDKIFDPLYEEKRQPTTSEHPTPPQEISPTQDTPSPAPAFDDLNAPVTRREARRRRMAVAKIGLRPTLSRGLCLKNFVGSQADEALSEGRVIAQEKCGKSPLKKTE